MILIITCKQDSHSDDVINELNRRGVSVLRVNTEDLLSKYKLCLRIEPDAWHGTIEDEIGRSVDLKSLKVAWLRKPSFNFQMKPDVHIDHVSFISGEARAFIDTIYSLPSVTWVNDPFSASRAKVKFQQLLLARDFGISIPRTVVTNDSKVALEFFKACSEVVATKAIYSSNITLHGINRAVPTSKVEADRFYDYVDNIDMAPTQLQEYVEKDFELRVTVIGTKVFAVRIDSQLSPLTKVDWRVKTGLNPHSVFELPTNVELFCKSFLVAQGLLFGAMDFIVTPKGDYVFLENNPFGQYQWLEMETGLPLTAEMCDLLISLSQ